MDFSPGKIVSRLLLLFGKDDGALNDEEEEVLEEFKRMLNDAVDGQLMIEQTFAHSPSRPSRQRQTQGGRGKVRDSMLQYDHCQVLNADQSGFVKEMYSNRTLTFKGQKKVEICARNTNATQHSYTIMPLLRADGTLADKLYVVMAEPGGRFPMKGHFQCDDLVVRAGRSHIMTKNLMIDWFKTVVFDQSCPTDQLLLVDSWSSFKDHDSIQALVPPDKNLEVKNIPAGTKSFVQPLDIYFFRPFKDMVKRVTSFVQGNEDEIDFPVHIRDNTLKMLSQIFHVFKAPIFKSMLEYPWRKGGYIYNIPAPFKTPSQICFPVDIANHFCRISSCAEIAFIFCPHCENKFCFSCYFID